MNPLNQITSLVTNFLQMGQNRILAVLGVVALAITLITVSGIYLNKPAYETLYVGLDGDDINQVTVALATVGMDFELGADGSSISVPAGMTGRARTLLAERGLPNSATSGYELFDNVGSLGLTSFMQEVTRVRAIEGEIARTIQAIDGISAARVHIVLPDRGNFRGGEQTPSASVMVRAGTAAGRRSATPIRHLVASSVPGLSVDDVTVLDSTGQLLASGDDFSNSNLSRSLGIVQSVQGEIERNIDKALAPFLGLDNFRSSVSAVVNTDSQQIQETIFDPESRTERSIRVTRENQTSNQTGNETPATVEQNLPEETGGTGTGGPQSSELAERKEEQTNFEINSKTIATVKNSYQLEKLSIAVVVNNGRLATMLGENPTEEQRAALLDELRQVVSSAAGVDQERGDQIQLTAMDFLAEQLLDENAAGNGMLDRLLAHSGSMINALAFVIVGFLVVWFGMRPLVRTVVSDPAAIEAGEEDLAGLELPDFSPDAVAGAPSMDGFGADFGFDSSEDVLTMEENGMDGQFSKRVKEGPEKRLSRMVEISEERAAKILRKWATEEAA